jgi:hypothetical protein
VAGFLWPDAKGRRDQTGDATVEMGGFALKLRDPSASERRTAFSNAKSVKAIQGTRGRMGSYEKFAVKKVPASVTPLSVGRAVRRQARDGERTATHSEPTHASAA